MELEGGILQLVGLLVLIIWRLVDWITGKRKSIQAAQPRPGPGPGPCQFHADLVTGMAAQSLELKATNLHLDEITRELRRLEGGDML